MTRGDTVSPRAFAPWPKNRRADVGVRVGVLGPLRTAAGAALSPPPPTTRPTAPPAAAGFRPSPRLCKAAVMLWPVLRVPLGRELVGELRAAAAAAACCCPPAVTMTDVASPSGEGEGAVGRPECTSDGGSGRAEASAPKPARLGEGEGAPLPPPPLLFPTPMTERLTLTPGCAGTNTGWASRWAFVAIITGSGCRMCMDTGEGDGRTCLPRPGPVPPGRWLTSDLSAGVPWTPSESNASGVAEGGRRTPTMGLCGPPADSAAGTPVPAARCGSS